MKILIIEDELLWQLKLQMMVEKIFHQAQIIIVDNCLDARRQMESLLPDLILSDISIDETVVFEVFVAPYTKLPIVFITEFPREDYYSRAESLSNSTFLVKPFHELSLKSAINTVMRRAGFPITENKAGLPVLDKYRRHLSVPLNKVIWIESDGNYSLVNTNDQKYIIKKSLTTMSKFLDEKFVQVQKSYIINSLFINHVDVASNQVVINGNTIPIGRTFRKNFLDFWRENGSCFN